MTCLLKMSTIQRVVSDPDQISIIDVQEISSTDKTKEKSAAKAVVDPISETYVQNAPSNLMSKEKLEREQDLITSSTTNYWNVLHVLTILIASTVSLMPQMLIPRYNVIYYPDSRYQFLIIITLLLTIVCLRMMLEYVLFTKEKSIMKIGVFFKLLLSLVLPWYVSIFSVYYYWTSFMGFEYPMPFQGILSNSLSFLTTMCILWFGAVFPSSLRLEHNFRIKMKKYVWYQLWWLVMNIQRDILSLAFIAVPGNLQFLFAMIIPAVKEMNKLMLLKIVTKMAGKDDERANVTLDIRLSIHYEFFVAIRMDGAENFTLISILLVDVFFQLWKTYKIIRLHHKITSEDDPNDAMQRSKESLMTKLFGIEFWVERPGVRIPRINYF